MDDWDDLRFLLAVAKSGSITLAARALKVNPSTVSRRIRALEKRLDADLLSRAAGGVELTEQGLALLPHAERVEAAVADLERDLLGTEREPSGVIRVASPEGLTASVLGPIFGEFLRRWPAVELRVVATFATANLALREADVSIRITKEPRSTLIGRRIARVARADYMARALPGEDPPGPPTRIGYVHDPDDPGVPDWKLDPEGPSTTNYRVSSPTLLRQAAADGLGIARLPCFLGDPDPLLVRVSEPTLADAMDLWLLSHREVRRATRIRALLDHVGEALDARRDLIEGRAPECFRGYR